MIDTIVLTLNKDLFEIRYPDLFTPSAQMVLFAHDRGITAKQNPTKKELLHGIYKPRLTLSHRINAQGKREITLKIEVSLPKLMFGNNFDELQEQDFAAVLIKLATILEQMGVITTTEALADASIFTVHYSKNIVLTDGSTPYHYINKIKEANIKLSLDVNQTDYRNDGHSYKWHCNSYEVVFYDKIKDLEISQKSDKRALEKDSALQIPLFETLKERRNKFEVLRMEVRLNKRAKIKQLYAKLGLPADLSFQGIFKHHFAQTILLYYLDELENTRSGLLDYKASSDKSLLTLLLFNNPDMSTQKILQLFGIKKAFETMNTRELRTMLATRNPNGLASPAVAARVGWYRLMNDVQKVKLPVAHSPFKVIREQLTVFKTLRLDNYTQI